MYKVLVFFTMFLLSFQLIGQNRYTNIEFDPPVSNSSNQKSNSQSNYNYNYNSNESNKSSNEISIYNAKGIAKAYVTTEDAVIYLWSGEPVAWISQANAIFGFNGKHLGWFDEGVILDLNGDCVGYFKGSINGATSPSGPKSPKSPKPVKTPVSNPGIAPNNNHRFSDKDLEFFLIRGYY